MDPSYKQYDYLPGLVTAAVTGLDAEALEHAVPEQMFSTPDHPADAVSAVKPLSKAAQQGQRIYHLTPSNMDSALPMIHHKVETMNEIRQALATGKEVITHTDPISVPGWSGAWYIITDPETGAGAYRISGGANGGWTDVADMVSPVLTFWETWDVAALGNKFSGFSKFLGSIGTLLGVFSFAAETLKKCKDVTQQLIVIGLMLAFAALIIATTGAFLSNPLGAILFSTTAGFIADKFMTGIRHVTCQ